MDPREDFTDDFLLSFWSDDDGQIAAGTLTADAGETEHQAAPDQADEAGPSSISPEATTQLNEMKNRVTQKSGTSRASKRRRGTPLDDEEKKERKKEADLKYRKKIKADIEDTKKELQDAKKDVERLETAKKSLNEESNTMFRNLQDTITENGKLQSEIRRLKETIWDQQQTLNTIWLNQEHVGKVEEELRGLKTKCYGLESMNASLMAERKTMTDNLQKAATNSEELELQIYSLNATITQQQELVNMFLNGLNQEVPMEQEPNERLGFKGDGGPINIGTSSGSEIQSLHSELSHQIEKFKREAGEAIRNVCAETTKQMLEVLEEMRAVEARMAEHMKSRNI